MVGDATEVGRREERLISATRAGDDSAFEQLYEMYAVALRAYVAGMLGDPAAAEDVTQEAFVKALRRMRATDRYIAFWPWMRQIARNAAIDHLRHQRCVPASCQDASLEDGRPVWPPPPREEPEPALEISQRMEELWAIVRRLPPQAARALVLREVCGLSPREAAPSMGVSHEGVDSAMGRARRAIFAAVKAASP